MKLVMIAAVALLVCTPARAEVTAEDAVNGCMQEMGYTEEECGCMLENVYFELTPLQVEYFLARAQRDDVATQRLMPRVGLFQRLDIIDKLYDAARLCVDGPFRLPRQ